MFVSYMVIVSNVEIESSIISGDLGYGEWAAWSFCSRSCGGGIKTRTRSCLLGHGKCDGADFSKLECNEDPCPGRGIDQLH